jgi:hypothetical protein
MLAAVEACEARGNAALWIASEYVPGPTLEAWASGGRVLAVSAAIDFMRRLSLGVQAALACGLSHPAINPRNLVVWRQEPKSGLQLDGKLLDLGLAGWMRPGPARLECAHFIAPETLSAGSGEQIVNEAVGARANVYSCGALLYYLTTGELPFKSSSIQQLMAAHVAGHAQLVRPSTYNDQISSALECVILGALAVRPCERYASPGEFASVLDAVESRDRRAARSSSGAALEHEAQASTTQGSQLPQFSEACAPAMQPLAALDAAPQAFVPAAQACAVPVAQSNVEPPSEMAAQTTQRSALDERDAKQANCAAVMQPSAADERPEQTLERAPTPQPLAASDLVAPAERPALQLQPSAAEELTKTLHSSAASQPPAPSAELASNPQPSEASRTAAELLAPKLLPAQCLAGCALPAPFFHGPLALSPQSAGLDLAAGGDPFARLSAASDAEAPGLTWGAAAEERLSAPTPEPSVARSRVAARPGLRVAKLRVAKLRVTALPVVAVAVSVGAYFCSPSVSRAPRSRTASATDSAPVESAHHPPPVVAASARERSVPAQQPAPDKTPPASLSVERASGPWKDDAEPARSDASAMRSAQVSMPHVRPELAAPACAAISSPLTAGVSALRPTAQLQAPAAVGGSRPTPRALAAAAPSAAVSGVARVQALEVRGALTAPVVRHAMEHVRHHWTECYVHVASVTGQIQFDPIHVALVIDEAGHARDLHITAPEPAALTACLSHAVRELTAEVPHTGTVSVLFDLDFEHLY